MSDRWIIVPNWEKFQHYTDRDPLWIKLYTELNSNDDWLSLSAAERGTLCTIWLEYARSRGQLAVQKVRQLCRQSTRSKHIESLNDAGFIKVSASKPLALARSREKKREASKEASLSKRRAPAAAAAKSGAAAPAKKKDARWRAEQRIENVAGPELAGLSDEHLRYVFEDEFKITDPDVISTLVSRVRETHMANLAEQQFQDELEAIGEEIDF